MEQAIDTNQLGIDIVAKLKTIYDPEIPVDIYEYHFRSALEQRFNERRSKIRTGNALDSRFLINDF